MGAPACTLCCIAVSMDILANNVYKRKNVRRKALQTCCELRTSNMLRKYVLLLLASLSISQGRPEDAEVIFLPATTLSLVQDEMPLAFTAFGERIALKLQKNRKLLAPSFRVWRHTSENVVEEVPELNDAASCHYLHSDSFGTAAVSVCEDGLVNGLVLLDNTALEITPLKEPMDSLEFLKRFSTQDEQSRHLRRPHVVKRSLLPSVNDSRALHSSKFIDFARRLPMDNEHLSRTLRARRSNDLTIELALFFDEAAYRLFAPFFDRSERRIRDMLLAYVNAVQALYYHPSLGTRIDVVLVRLDIMQRQPSDLLVYGGERSQLLDSFCSYAERHNPLGDDHLYHWDMALYVSGLDFYAAEDGSRVTMGLAPVNGTCYEPWSCVIAELGTTNRFGKPYPSAGFTSVYIAAHEMGHNLGMRHDSVDNYCPKDGFIMSPSRGVQGETVWSACSRDVALRLHRLKPCLWDKPSPLRDERLGHARFRELPGREWTAKRQCELLLRDKDATVASLSNACQSLRCRTPHRSGYYWSGPALDGTICAYGKECRGGECLPRLEVELETPNEGSKPGWTEWQAEVCKSGCVQRSKGSRARRRMCIESAKSDKSVCGGFAYDVLLCDDRKLCPVNRKSVEEYGADRCRNFSNYLPELEAEGGALQAPHENSRLWIACAIFCKRGDISSYYTPRIELNDLGLDPYYPDGTWCHEEDGEDYFCLQHHCLPESFRFGKDSFSRLGDEEDRIMGAQNAAASGFKVREGLVGYLSLGEDGLPISKSLPDELGGEGESEDEWIDKDYFVLPEDKEGGESVGFWDGHEDNTDSNLVR